MLVSSSNRTLGGRNSMTLAFTDMEKLLVAAVERVDTVVDLAQRICAVPAPTGSERERAKYIMTLLRERGYAPEIDEISNVYTLRHGRGDHPEPAQRPVLMLL